MKKNILLVVGLLFSFTQTILAQTNCGVGIFTVRARQISYTGESGCDDSGTNCSFEFRFTPTSDAGSGAAGPGCIYHDGGANQAINDLVAQHQFSTGACPVLPNTITVGYNLHEDDSFFSNCTNNGGDDGNCSTTQALSTLGAFAAPGTPQNFTVVCGAWTVTFSITYTPIVVGGTSCASMVPICSGNSFAFSLPITGSAGTGLDYDAIGATAGNPVTFSQPVNGNSWGCLLAVNRPVWWFFRVATAGAVAMNLTAPADVDYVLYGPYRNLVEAQAACGRQRAITDCAYSASATEPVRIADGQVGDIYVLLVLNYAGTTQNATLSQTGGAGAIDCSIVNSCFINNITVNSVGACNTANNTYTASVRVTYTYPPTLPTNLVVNGQTFAMTAADVTAGFKNVTLTALPANSQPVSVIANFSTSAACTLSVCNIWTAPAPCDPCPANPGRW